MQNYQLRQFTPSDIQQVVALQAAYAEVYPGAAVIPGEVYVSPGFHGGEDVFCAFDAEGRLQGYAPVYANLIREPNDVPHTVWAEVKAHPALESPEALKDALFEQVVKRARQVTQEAPGHAARLMFQYYTSEAPSIAFVVGKGARYTASVFTMRRPLSDEIPAVPQPAGVEVRPWRMETEAEQRAYIEARNEAFPEAPAALADWQYFMRSPMWAAGTTITAFDGEQVVGSVAVYGDEDEIGRLGRRAGHTEYIFVREGWRKRGIAGYLITQALDYLRVRGMEEALLEVRASNRKALQLYESLGYRTIDESQLYAWEL